MTTEDVIKCIDAIDLQQGCSECQGAGRIITGEYFVTRDMAIDAGDLNLEGEHYDFDYAMCSMCEGSGFIQLSIQDFIELLKSEIEKSVNKEVI